MSIKAYKTGSFLVLENTVTGDIKEFLATAVQIRKKKVSVDEYEVLVSGTRESVVFLSELVDEVGDPYTENAWDTFRFSVTQDNPSSDYTETIVNISSAQILAMGTTPIELLPAAGANSYYDIDKIIVEYNGGIINDFTLATHLWIYDSRANYYFPPIIESSVDPVVILTSTNSETFVDTDVYTKYTRVGINFPLSLSTYTGDDPVGIDADGTLRVKIYHKTITFGA